MGGVLLIWGITDNSVIDFECKQDRDQPTNLTGTIDVALNVGINPESCQMKD